MKSILTLIACALAVSGFAQSPYSRILGSWDKAGCTAPKPAFPETKNILDYGADAGGKRSTSAALTAAITALGDRPGIIEFPAGDYFFDAPVPLQRDDILLRGSGHTGTRLRFDLGGSLRNLISISGAAGADSSLLSASFLRGDSVITVADPGLFQAGDWICLSIDDAAYMTSSWACGTLGQTVRIRSIRGNQLVLESKARFNYTLQLRPRVRKIEPRSNIGIECLAVERLDATAGQTSNIVFDRAVNCWITGIESDKCNFAHIELNRASNIEIRNSWLHDAFGYSGGGQGYGVLLQTGSNECLVSGNYFRRLRHSMLLQSGANGNVLSYNYSTKPHWTETGLPDSSAGEIVLHGNYPFMNLAEGNVVQNIVIDDSHGKNGPLNTFFRNRANGYGVFMNFTKPTDSVVFIANEVTNEATGLYFVSGSGHIQVGNNYKGNMIGSTAAIPEKSLYLPANTRPECSDGLPWPAIGEIGRFNSGAIPAMTRVAAGKPASCACTDAPVPTRVKNTASVENWVPVPNPARSFVTIQGPELPEHVALYDATGRLVLQLPNPTENRIGLPELPGGIYMLQLQVKGTSVLRRLMILP